MICYGHFIYLVTLCVPKIIFVEKQLQAAKAPLVKLCINNRYARKMKITVDYLSIWDCYFVAYVLVILRSSLSV